MKIDREKCFFLRSEDKQLTNLFGAPSDTLVKKRVQLIKYLALCAYLLMLAMQIWQVITFNGTPVGDAARYINDAFWSVEQGVWYPTARNFIGSGAAGTGYVNFLCLLFRITANVKIAYAANILLVQLMLFSAVYIVSKITGSDTVRYVCAAVFCLLGTYWSEVCIARTEIFFTALAFLALALAMRGGKLCPVLSGTVLAYANWARPIAVSFVIAIAWLFFYKREKILTYVKFAAGFSLIVLFAMSFTYLSSGEWVYQPNVAAGNMLIGANADADGSYDDVVFKKGNAGYLDPELKKTLTYEEINTIYSKAATDWIKENPLKYLSLMPKKLLYFYVSDTYSGSVYFNNKIQTGGAEYIREVLNVLRGNGDRELQTGDILVIYNQAYYMLVLLLFAVGVIYSMVKGCWRSMSFLYGIIIIGTAMSMVTVGGSRYHFPYLPIIIITASMLIDAVFIRRKCKKTK